MRMLLVGLGVFILASAGALAFLVRGCDRDSPTLAGGKPVSHWLKALQDPNAKVRKAAVVKLGNAGTADPEALSAVMGALTDPDAAVRYEAILALARCGPAASGAVPQIERMQKQDRSARVRAGATQALEKFRAGEKN
jgi:HEAT repeat protein